MPSLVLPPAFLFILAGVLIPFLKGRVRNLVAVVAAILGLIQVLLLNSDMSYPVHALGFQIDLLRADKLAIVFGIVFTFNAVAAFLYGWVKNKDIELSSALLYIGAALGAVFAADVIGLYIFWELMAITSVMLILARKTESSMAAAKRYILVHVAGGLILLAGIILHVNATGSIEFTGFTQLNTSSILILIGFLVNAAAVPFASWLPDAYPQATIFGGVVLSAYTSKTAIYTLMRGFVGWEWLIPIGLVMAIYGIVYGLMERDIRRILAYAIVNQGGFMVVAAGVGSELAVIGGVTHAFACILYTALLWMTTGAIIKSTGTSHLNKLGGLAKSMPWTAAFTLVGALAISSSPFLSGFTTKSITLAAIEQAHLFWPWIILEIASIGTFLLIGLKLCVGLFLGKESHPNTTEAQGSKLVAMGVLSAACLAIGIYPEWLYHLMPGSQATLSALHGSFSDVYIHHFSHVVTQLQKMSVAALVFFLFAPLLRQKDAILLDLDWLYRIGAKHSYSGIKKCCSSINRNSQAFFIDKVLPNCAIRIKNTPMVQRPVGSAALAIIIVLTALLVL